ncbi:hypothetical protein MHH60_10295 [Paenibacillus sp. FSL H7-0716]|nr:hypothetical protein [Paenibacillus odorifer]
MPKTIKVKQNSDFPNIGQSLFCIFGQLLFASVDYGQVKAT